MRYDFEMIVKKNLTQPKGSKLTKFKTTLF